MREETGMNNREFYRTASGPTVQIIVNKYFGCTVKASVLIKYLHIFIEMSPLSFRHVPIIKRDNVYLFFYETIDNTDVKSGVI